MDFVVANQEGVCALYLEQEALSGVGRIAAAVAKDIFRVTGQQPVVARGEVPAAEYVIAAMTLGHSMAAEKLDFSELRGLREVYELRMVEDFPEAGKKALVVCGSDKRGTIYGLFHISELLGVSAWVDFADVTPVVRKEVVLQEGDCCRSKEPSVTYRGFFINDEWPSFGGWTMEKNGGFNAVCYERIFELLLRLKGNYLWPAMWSASFPLDGPGLLNEELADELGVVISFSHHEPCMRASEEWDKVKGPDSSYGSDWNYYTNREGLLRYWDDGLARSGRFDNIITIGMRGERDTSMLGPDATLAQNISLLRDIIHEQRQLIAKNVNTDLSKVPQMLALYKEVEAYFYGNDEAKGLIGWEELEDVILLLCEDNFGNMRTLPTEAMRAHRGGYGMYYHFDYHGGPISYEWVCSTPLTKIWEQMTQAYEFGVRELWVVNVGDLKPQELPLTYFMDLAYDYEAYGIKHPNETGDYLLDFAQKQFGGWVRQTEGDVVADIAGVLSGYTRMNLFRRPEALNRKTYHPVYGKEAARMLSLCDSIEKLAESSLEKLAGEICDAYVELVYFPAVASCNLVRMQIYAGINGMLLTQGNPLADAFYKLTNDCVARDAELTELYHSVADGKWNHMMSSKHIGFVSWNDEGSGAPKVYTLAQWNALETKPDDVWFPCEETLTAAHLRLTAEDVCPKEMPLWCEESDAWFVPFTFAEEEGVLSMEACHAAENTSGKQGEQFVCLDGYGKSLASMKVLPNTGTFLPDGSGPSLTYFAVSEKGGTYRLTLYLAPSNPCKNGGHIRYGVQVGEDGMIDVIDSIPEGFCGGDCYNVLWCEDVLNNVRYSSTSVTLQPGNNMIRILAIDPGFVLQKLVLVREDVTVPKTYFGPAESWYQQ